MKRIISTENYVQLQELNDGGEFILQLGFELSGLTYKIEKGNVKFYLKEDYFYKNSVWSADLPIDIDGTEYDEDTIGEGLGTLFTNSGGGGVSGVSSVNGKTGAVRLTASDVGAYSKTESDDLLQGIEDKITGLDEQIDLLENELNGHDEKFDDIDVKVQTIEDKIQEIENDIDALESDNTTNKADIATLKNDVNTLKSRVTSLETAAQNYLVASNIKSGTNIAVSVNGKDVTISTVGIPTVEGLAELEEQVSANTTAIEGIQQEITEKEHFRGYFNTNSEIQSLTATNGDFAYSAQSGTKWVYNNNAWADTQTSVPDKTVEKSTTVPLMDGTATIGSSNRYAAADHIHPTDTTRASQSDLAALETQVQANTITIANKADKSDTYAKSQVDTAIEAIKPYVVDFYKIATQPITDEDWNGITAAVNAKRPIYANLDNFYYVSESLSIGSNEIVMTASDSWNIYFYTFIKNGTNDYTFSYVTRPYYTDAEHTKLAGIEAGAEVNVQTNWNETDTTSDAYIKNKPTNVSAFTNDAGYLTSHQSLSNYYTKTESDNRFALKFTDVDNIQKVSSLPANPDSRTLYLIPV